jgi:tRNA (adenine37-N6)-methyltransferase
MIIQYQPIGVIHTPFTDLKGMPIQPTSAAAAKGTVELLPEYHAGLKDLDGFSHIILLYHFHKSRGYDLQLVPYLDTREHGVFATRAPKRPNPIGLSVVRLLGIEQGVLLIEHIDVLDGTPLLDIKPYIPDFQSCEKVRTGWLEEVDRSVATAVSDDRFDSSS